MKTILSLIYLCLRMLILSLKAYLLTSAMSPKQSASSFFCLIIIISAMNSFALFSKLKPES
jgi:hypothetical protein